MVWLKRARVVIGLIDKQWMLVGIIRFSIEYSRIIKNKIMIDVIIIDIEWIYKNILKMFDKFKLFDIVVEEIFFM